MSIDEKIDNLLSVIQSLCEENGIEFLAQFIMDKGKEIVYHYQTDDVMLDASTIISQYQKLDLKVNKLT